LQYGFLTAIVDEDQLISQVSEVAQQIGSLAPLTIWAVKEGQRRLNAAGQAIDFDDVVGRVYGSSDFAQGVRAYLEKRKPAWRGQ
jgi:enoyl-CoA hydratase/carnithine racemase